MKILILTILGMLTLGVVARAQKPAPIPKNATILENQSLNAKRKLILWMPDPKKNPYAETEDEIYTCPDQTRGSYYSGEVHVTLVNSQTNRKINDIVIKSDDEYGENDTTNETMDIPYLIRGGYYYKVPDPSSSVERKPQIMALKDYNSDGLVQEFVLFNAEACMGLGTTLIGYSKKQDRVIQYPITLRSPEGTRTQFWADYLFSKKPVRPGYWRYEVDYRGRDGTLDEYTVRYDKGREKFSASVTRQE